jgi:HEPN domain-containing protein
MAHSDTAVMHFESGRYREAVLSARLAVEVAVGGRGEDVKRRLDGAPQDVSTAGRVLQMKRNIAVHEGSTRVEQKDAMEAIRAMKRLLDYLGAERRPTVTVEAAPRAPRKPPPRA